MFDHNHSPSTTMAICGGLSLVRPYRVRPQALVDLARPVTCQVNSQRV